MSRIIGIDLGTTNSLVAYVDETTRLPRVIPDADGRPLLPSVVAFTPDGIVVGEPARRQLARRPADTVYSVKRLMGRGFEDVKDEARYLPFRILPGEGLVRLAVGGREVTPPEVYAVVLVGGSTRVPLVRRRVQELFGKTPHSQLNPDEVVALGAAVQAHILAGGITNMLLLDVTPLSLGIETLGGIVSVLLPRNTTIPTTAREMFTTSVDGQNVVDLHVLQGERELAKDCRSLGRFELRIDPMPAGMPKIEVTFLIDANGILQVQAKEQRTGKAASIEVKPTYGLNEAEVERMIEDSFTYAEADVETRMLIEARNEADTVITHVERALRQGRELVPSAERGAIEAAVAALRAACAGDDRD